LAFLDGSVQQALTAYGVLGSYMTAVNTARLTGKGKHPRDPVQLSSQVFDIAIGETEDTLFEPTRHPPKGRAGGLKGGKARAKRLTPEQRRKIASAAARARWRAFDGRDWEKMNPPILEL
jgi:hypothetical protein